MTDKKYVAPYKNWLIGKGTGAVLYQEVPASAARGGFTGRGLQGIVDGILKAFGI